MGRVVFFRQASLSVHFYVFMQVGRNDLAVRRPNWKSDYEIGKNVPRKDKIHFLINLVIH